MGVTGLWKLIEPCGKPVPVETLEGKILAIDISIWLHQVVKGFQDNKGSALNNAHLLGLFHRLCKLLYYRVKPVFVFDGCVPQLKRDTIARRQQQRSKLNNEAERIQALLLQSLAKEKVVQQALGSNSELILKANKRGNTANRRDDDADNMYLLPELPNTSKSADESSDMNNSSLINEDYVSFTEESSFEESSARRAYYNNLQSIDVRSQHFKALPAEVRHEILVDIKETRKQSSWGRLHELPSKNDEFSDFQMKRLLKRRAVQESIEEAQQDMAGVTLSYSELQNFFTEEGILQSDLLEKGSKHICSDEHTRFLLVRDLKKKLSKEESQSEEIKKEPKDEKVIEIGEGEGNSDLKEPTMPKLEVETEAEAEEKPSEEEREKLETPKLENDKLGKEYDCDLELAIALSLEENQVYNEKDYEYESAKALKLNTQQKKELKNAAVGPARAYMIEYGGMNDEEVVAIAEETVVELESDDRFKDLFDSSMPIPPAQEMEKITLHVSDDEEETRSGCEEALDKSTTSSLKEPSSLKNLENSQEMVLKVSDESGSDSDSDLEEVPFDEPLPQVPKLSIVVNVDETMPPEEDFFADIFANSNDKNSKLVLNSQPFSFDEEIENLKQTEEKNLMNLDMKISESEEIIEETPKFFEEKSIFEKYRSPGKKQQNENLSKTPVKVLEPARESENKMLSILEELKQQKEKITSMSLDDFKQMETPPTIMVSDDEPEEAVGGGLGKVALEKNEIIELFDSQDQKLLLETEAEKTSAQKTPNKSIKEFFPTNYVVKRTPDKPKEEETTPPANVKSPFFVNKTPKSSRRKSDSESPTLSAKKNSKASKILFPEENLMEADTEVAKVTTEDLIQDMADTLKEQKTEEELKSMAEELARERLDLEAERNRQDRMGMSISQRMSSECQELLRLFGVPYIVAPMEAEAQCAFLDAIQLTNGTITDDSDIWLFGGRTVYKNFFAQNKHVLEFKAEQIEKSFNCDRKKLIQLACLVGSDYTPGIHGIGAVTAMEILALFSGGPKMLDDKDSSGNTHIIVTNILSGLSKFRDWWFANKASLLPPGSSTRLALFKKLKNIDLHEGFPNMAVVEAYLSPKVDENKEAFSWGYPDVESIKEFAKKTFGWTTSKTNDILNPVLKKLNDKKTQATIQNYFASKGVTNRANRFDQMKVSKRVQNAVARMTGEIPDTPEEPSKPKRARRAKATSSEPSAAVEEGSEEPSTSKGKTTKRPKKKLAASEPLAVVPLSTENNPSEDSESIPIKKTKRAVRIPNPRQVIPQREKDLEQLQRNKQKAIEILKKSSQTQKKKRQP